MTPFVIFSLPRSRSTWLSVLLSHRGGVIGHDIGIESESPEDFAQRLRFAGGSCETGAAFAWRKIRALVPDCRFAVIRRPVPDVIHSLEVLGIVGQVDEIYRRDEHLKEIAALPDALTVQYSDLDAFSACDRLSRFCLGKPLDPDWYEKMGTTNVQVDLKWQLQRLYHNRAQIAEMKRLATA